MNLENVIKWSIYNYPILYRKKDYETSRISVLGHIFLTIGTEYEWHPDGFLADIFAEDYRSKVMEELPEGFFEKNLWDMEVEIGRKAEVQEALKGRFFYFTERGQRDRTVYCIFESDDIDEAEEIYLKYDADTSRLRQNVKRVLADKKRWEEYGLSPRYYVSKASSISLEDPERYPRHNPYPLSEYSPLVEMLNGRTNSPHIDNFELVYIKPDWIQGAIDIAEYAFDYYSDPEKYCHHYQHPSKSTLKSELDWAIKEGREESFRKSRGLVNGKTPEQRSEECWKRFHSNQLDLLKRFLDKYKNSEKTV